VYRLRLHALLAWLRVQSLWIRLTAPLSVFNFCAYSSCICIFRVRLHVRFPGLHVLFIWLHECPSWLHVRLPWLHVCLMWPQVWFCYLCKFLLTACVPSLATLGRMNAHVGFTCASMLFPSLHASTSAWMPRLASCARLVKSAQLRLRPVLLQGGGQFTLCSCVPPGLHV
jgi:hypothetical protein